MGRLLMLLSAAGFGTVAIFGKLAYAAGVSPDTLLLLRFTLAAAVMGLVLLVRPRLRALGDRSGGRVGERLVSRRRIVLTGIGLGAVGYATASMLFFTALTRIDASLGALILYTYPLLVTLAAAAMGRDRLTTRRGIGVLAASAGTVLVLLGASGMRHDLLGVALALASAGVYTAYMLVSDTVASRIPRPYSPHW